MHQPVLLTESIELLNIKANGVYVDGTFGRGGHSLAILNILQNGCLVMIDKDKEAINAGANLLKESNAAKLINSRHIRCELVHDSFANIDAILKRLELHTVDGILLDLGVSSPQLDTANRGFSFMQDGDLDMRMNKEAGISLKDYLATVSETELARVLWQYGEEPFARKIAKNVIQARTIAPIERTLQLVAIIKNSVGVRYQYTCKKHVATRSFQALRIVINNELNDLTQALGVMPTLLKQGGRLVVISFHSLEDRCVKQAFNHLVLRGRGDALPKWVALKDEELQAMQRRKQYRLIAKKIKPSDLELTNNRRSRSSLLRALEAI